MTDAPKTTHNTDRVGINAVERLFLDMGWLFREQTVSDYGIDAHAEETEGGVPTGRLIALQIKSGASYFKKRGEAYVYYGEARHLDYWENHRLPVFLVLHNPDDRMTVWGKIERRRVRAHGEDRWSIEIPATNILDERAAGFLAEGLALDPANARRLRLEFDLPLIAEIAGRVEGGEDAYFRVQEWVNKSLNFRTTDIVFGEPDDQAAYRLETWLPAPDINDLMNFYFPWADFQYAEPVENYENEIDEHVLAVTINTLGRAALEVDEFYRNGAPRKAEKGDFAEEEENDDGWTMVDDW